VTIESLGGIRLIRKLGEGDRAEVHLVRLRDGVGDTAALKVYREHVDPRSISAEIEALARAEGPHILPLLDLTTTQDGVPALLLDRLVRGSLAGLMRTREYLRAGEVITILAPLAQALARMHRDGAVHAGIRPDAVLFDAAGAPVLACFGRAFPIGRELPPARLSAEPGVALDLGAFASLARSVLARVDDPVMRSLSDFAQPGPALESHDWLERFGDRLFDASDACAVEFSAPLGAAPRPEGAVLPSRAALAFSLPNAIAAQHATGDDRFARGDQQVASGVWHESGARSAERIESATTGRSPVISAALAAISDRVPVAARETLFRAVTVARTVRTRWWLMLGVAGILVTVALVVVAARPVNQDVAPASTPPATSDDVRESAPAATGVDDPLDALVALLRSRERCIAQLSVLCLDAVDQSGSAALAADQVFVRALQSGTEATAPWTIDRSRLVELERLGDSALLGVADPGETEPASILLMKGEAGWRIRDYLER
jgi:hypothetical protein